MKTLRNYAPILLLIAAFVIPPVLLPHILASSAGLLVIGNFNYNDVLAKLNWTQNESTYTNCVQQANPLQRPLGKEIFALKRGTVTFETINGKLTSRYVKAT